MSDSATPSKPWLRRFLLGLGPLALIAGIGWFLFGGGRYVSTDNAYVKADVLLVSAEVAGRAVEVPVRANATVRRGDLLLRIDPAPYRIAVAQAQAQLATVENEIAAERAAYRESWRHCARRAMTWPTTSASKRGNSPWAAKTSSRRLSSTPPPRR